MTTINAVGQFQMQTATFIEELKVSFNNSAETIVVVMKTPVMSEGNIYGGAAVNGDVVDTVGNELICFFLMYVFLLTADTFR